MSWKEYEAVGDSTLYGGPKEGSVKSVLSRIAYLIRSKGTPNCPVDYSNPSEGYLSEWTGFSERTVRQAIARMVEDKVVFVEVYRLDSGYRKNRYKLNMAVINAASRYKEEETEEKEPQAETASGDGLGGAYGTGRAPVGDASPQAVKTSGHRRSRVKPQAVKTEATGGDRLKAVGLSSVEQVELSSSTNGHSHKADKTEDQEQGQGQDQEQLQPLSEVWIPEEESSPVDSDPTTPVPPPPPPRPEFVNYTRTHTWEKKRPALGDDCLTCGVFYLHAGKQPCEKGEGATV